MIPLRDTIASQRFPIVNYLLIALTTWAFFLELFAGPGLEQMLHTYGLVPARYFSLLERLGPFAPQLYLPFFTSIFLHGIGHWRYCCGSGARLREVSC